MAERYSVWSLLKHAMGGHKGWERAWRDPEPKKNYEVIIIGGGGHGLATAYYLARNHGVRNIAIVEKGYIGSGNIYSVWVYVLIKFVLSGKTCAVANHYFIIKLMLDKRIGCFKFRVRIASIGITKKC